MYESFFGLSDKPFKLTPDPRYFYLSESHREALAALVYGVRERVGLITLTGPVGVGKTMILASFLDQIREHAETASFSGSVSGDRIEFLKDLCSVLDIAEHQDSLFGVSQAIKDFAIRKAGEGRSLVVLVDEAQDLGLEELEHFHHLSNLETPEAKLVQIVLAGAEKLDEKLQEKRLEALWQRVAIRCAIKPIEPEETIAYIFHRMRVAGSATSGLFSDAALWRIVNFARGVPRLINLVCNQAMISAYSSGRLPVDEDVVLEALKELDGGHLGLEAEGGVGREEIGKLVETVSQRQEAGAAPPEGDNNPGAKEREDGYRKVEAEEEKGITVWTRHQWGVISWFCPGRRSALALILVLLIAMVGVVMATGLLKARDDVVERVEVGLLEESDAGWRGDVPEKQSLWYEMRRGGPERPAEENDVAEIRPELLPLRWPEVEEVGVELGGALDREEKVSRSGIAPEDGSPAGEKMRTIQAKDIARIALERYGRLDVEILRILRTKNPQIRDWNRLDQTVRLLLPEMPQPTKGGVDFYTIQVGAFRGEEGAAQRVSDLEKRGAQNLFLLRGGADKKLTFVCVGVFESGRDSWRNLQQIREWGFKDAFPTRIKEKRLEDILQPYTGSGAGMPPIEERRTEASGFPLARK
jgi:general secretion pathway protein A